jgi:HK97 family phage portal protein
VLFQRAVAQLTERRQAGEWGSSDPPPPGLLGGFIEAGQPVNEYTALQLAAVYGSVSVIADACATLPIETFTSDLPGSRPLPPGPLITRPYSLISRIDWIVQYVMSMALRGNFFGHIVERDDMLYPTQIRPVHPSYVTVRRIRTGPDAGRPEYRFWGHFIPLDDVFHIRNLSVAGALVGLNPIEQLRVTLGLARAQDLYGGAYFENSAVPAGVIEIEGELDDLESRRLAVAWKDAHTGPKARSTAVLTGGATFRPITITNDDSQFLESRQFSQGEISGMIFRVPPHMIGLVDKTTSWGTGIAEQEQGFVTNTLMGYLGRLEEALTTVGPQDGRVNRFNVKRRLRGNVLQRYQAYALGLASGWLCQDDVRSSEDMPPLPDGLGQTFMVPINSQTLVQAVEASKEPVQMPEPSKNGGSPANA